MAFDFELALGDPASDQKVLRRVNRKRRDRNSHAFLNVVNNGQTA